MHSLWLKTEQACDFIALIPDLLEDELSTAPDKAELDLDGDPVDSAVVPAVGGTRDLHAFLHGPIAYQGLPDRTLTTRRLAPNPPKRACLPCVWRRVFIAKLNFGAQLREHCQVKVLLLHRQGVRRSEERSSHRLRTGSAGSRRRKSRLLSSSSR